MTESYDLYRMVFIIGAILAGLFLLISVLLFFVLKIPQVIGNLSGSTARKAIRKLREETANTAGKSKGESMTTDELSAEKRPKTRRPDRQKAQETVLLDDSNETTVLPTAEETTMLTPASETTVLASGGETAMLPQEPEAAGYAWQTPVSVQPFSGVFSVDYDITFIHTDEIIR